MESLKPFFIANRLRLFSDIAHNRRVKHGSPHLIHGLHEMSEDNSAYKVVHHIEEALHGGQAIVIDNRAGFEIVCLVPLSQGRIEVVRIPRQNSNREGVKCIDSPEFKAGFFEGKRRVEFTLSIFGRVIGEKNGTLPRELTRITSDGNYSPRAFTIFAGGKVFLARVDKTKSLTCGLEYQGGANWYVSG